MLPTELTNIHDLAFSPDGKMLAAAGGRPAEDGTVELFRWPEQTLLRRLSPHDDLIYAIAWRTDARQLATASADQRIGVYDIASASAAPAPARHISPDTHARYCPRYSFPASASCLPAAATHHCGCGT